MAARAKKHADTPAPFDLSTRYAAETVDVTIFDPASLAKKIDTGMRITIASAYSPEARAAAVQSAGTDDAAFLEQIVAVTRGWKGFEVKGAPVDFTPENVRALYTDPRTAWVFRQVLTAYLDLSRFFETGNAS